MQSLLDIRNVKHYEGPTHGRVLSALTLWQCCASSLRICSTLNVPQHREKRRTHTTLLRALQNIAAAVLRHLLRAKVSATGTRTKSLIITRQGQLLPSSSLSASTRAWRWDRISHVHLPVELGHGPLLELVLTVRLADGVHRILLAL